MMKKMFIVFAALLLCCCPARAGKADDDKAAELKKAPAAYAKLRALGLPDVKNCKYMKLTRSFGHSFGQPVDTALNSGAWLLKESPDGKAEFSVFGEISAGEFFDAVKMEKILREKTLAAAKDGGGDPAAFEEIGRLGEMTVKWEDSDLKKDIERLTGVFQAELDKDDDGGRPAGCHSRLFILCAQLNGCGMEKEAETILGKLIGSGDDTDSLLLSALLTSAKAEAKKASGEFSRTKDMKKFAAAVKGIAAKYKDSCDVSKLEELSGGLDKQLAAGAPPPVSFDGAAAEDKKLADDLARASGNSYSLAGCGLWLLPQPRRDEAPAKSGDVIRAVTDRKLKALPLLAAMADDNWRTNMAGGPSMEWGRGEDSVDISAPVTRGQIARKLLEPVLLGQGDDAQPMEKAAAEDIKQAAQETVKKLEGKTDEQAAMIYLAEGSRAQKSLAAGTLAGMAKDHNIPEFETFCLECGDSDWSTLNFAVEYIKNRKSAAAEFGKKIVERIQGGKIPKKQKDTMTETVKTLISGEKYSDFIAAVASGKTKADFNTLLTKTSAEAPEEAVSAILDGLKAAKSSAAKDSLINLLARTVFPVSGQFMPMRRSGKAVPFDKIMKLPAWKDVFADKDLYGVLPLLTYGDFAAALYEKMEGGKIRPDGNFELNDDFSLVCYDFYKARAIAKIDGKNPDDAVKTPVPADQAPKEKVDGIIKSIESCGDASALKEAGSKVSFEFYNAVAEAVGKNPGLSKKIAPLVSKINGVRCFSSGEPLEPAFKEFDGQEISAELVQKIAGKLKDLKLKKRDISAFILRGAAFSGGLLAVTDVNSGDFFPDARNGFAISDSVIKLTASGYKVPVCVIPVSGVPYKAGKLDKEVFDELESYRKSKIDGAAKIFYEKLTANLTDAKRSPFYSVIFAIQPLDVMTPKPAEKDGDSDGGDESGESFSEE
jgi:hypothetical protein